ncbi:hypothetical protein IP92_04361 [Pseudoduganella flava]|uniref:Uncharacterized protein n=1 Tax=Pseudoduganella flava TaxID=871742 RepID=A0A562PIX8_9BURK|nr:hypothetical protein [Pseudoduganella flava]QGZ41999.1 hypothetical protein GO485_25065 [Pseudoduganella flava]TWI44411.1 hypothetical protein IP92_04361 [Pseudoduganella flava]
MQNDDKQRPGQPTIHTHLPDSVPPEDVKKIVGEPVPHGADYNSPPPRGAAKSMGSGLDESVGGPGLGTDPMERGLAATRRDQDTRADDRHMGNLQQGGQQAQSGQGSQQSQSGQGGQQSQAGQSAAPGNAQRDAGSRSEGLLPRSGETDGRYDVAEEVSLDQQSDQARRVGSMEEAAKGPHGDQLADAVARTVGKGADKGPGKG